MGQKVNPIGLRVGNYRKWTSNWFFDSKMYTNFLHLNFEIERFFKGFLYIYPKQALLLNCKFVKTSFNTLVINVIFYRLKNNLNKSFDSHYKFKKELFLKKYKKKFNKLLVTKKNSVYSKDKRLFLNLISNLKLKQEKYSIIINYKKFNVRRFFRYYRKIKKNFSKIKTLNLIYKKLLISLLNKRLSLYQDTVLVEFKKILYLIKVLELNINMQKRRLLNFAFYKIYLKNYKNNWNTAITTFSWSAKNFYSEILTNKPWLLKNSSKETFKNLNIVIKSPFKFKNKEKLFNKIILKQQKKNLSFLYNKNFILSSKKILFRSKWTSWNNFNIKKKIFYIKKKYFKLKKLKIQKDILIASKNYKFQLFYKNFLFYLHLLSCNDSQQLLSFNRNNFLFKKYFFPFKHIFFLKRLSDKNWIKYLQEKNKTYIEIWDKNLKTNHNEIFSKYWQYKKIYSSYGRYSKFKTKNFYKEVSLIKNYNKFFFNKKLSFYKNFYTFYSLNVNTKIKNKRKFLLLLKLKYFEDNFNALNNKNLNVNTVLREKIFLKRGGIKEFSLLNESIKNQNKFFNKKLFKDFKQIYYFLNKKYYKEKRLKLNFNKIFKLISKLYIIINRKTKNLFKYNFLFKTFYYYYKNNLKLFNKKNLTAQKQLQSFKQNTLVLLDYLYLKKNKVLIFPKKKMSLFFIQNFLSKITNMKVTLILINGLNLLNFSFYLNQANNWFNLSGKLKLLRLYNQNLRRYKNIGFYIKDLINITFICAWTKNIKFLANFIGYLIRIQPRQQRKRQLLFFRFIVDIIKNICFAQGNVDCVRIKIKGRYGKRPRSNSLYFIKGNVSLQTFNNRIEYGSSKAITKNGALGIKIWVCYNSNFSEDFNNLIKNYFFYAKNKTHAHTILLNQKHFKGILKFYDFFLYKILFKIKKYKQI